MTTGTKAPRERLGGRKKCDECGATFEAYREWDKYDKKKCRNKARSRRFWTTSKRAVKTDAHQS